VAQRAAFACGDERPRRCGAVTLDTLKVEAVIAGSRLHMKPALRSRQWLLADRRGDAGRHALRFGADTAHCSIVTVRNGAVTDRWI
jgi:hypothetical protein